MLLKAIGHIRSPFKDKFGTPRQSQIARKSISQLIFDKKTAPPEMTEGLEPGAYIWVLFWFHLNKQKKPLTKVHPPRLRGKTMGVLATRSPHRPNPIGLSLAKVTALEKNHLVLEGLDLVDGTPVLDIKPYLAEFDVPAEKNDSWVNEHPFPKLEVSFEDEAFTHVPASEVEELRDRLGEILSEDPRPLAYLKRPAQQYWVKYGDYDIGFTIKKKTLNVNKIKVLT